MSEVGKVILDMTKHLDKFLLFISSSFTYNSMLNDAIHRPPPKFETFLVLQHGLLRMAELYLNSPICLHDIVLN
jgi:hypothetical protein